MFNETYSVLLIVTFIEFGRLMDLKSKATWKKNLDNMVKEQSRQCYYNYSLWDLKDISPITEDKQVGIFLNKLTM